MGRQTHPNPNVLDTHLESHSVVYIVEVLAGIHTLTGQWCSEAVALDTDPHPVHRK